MYSAHINPQAVQRYQWRQAWPTLILVIVAIIQLVLTAAIASLESWSIVINMYVSFNAVGYVATVFYTITWISTFTVGRDRTPYWKQILISSDFSLLQA